MEIKILGTGCKKCRVLLENTESALKSLGLEAELSKITDVEEILAYGIMTTPSLVIDEKIIATGKVLKTKEIAEHISRFIDIID